MSFGKVLINFILVIATGGIWLLWLLVKLILKWLK